MRTLSKALIAAGALAAGLDGQEVPMPAGHDPNWQKPPRRLPLRIVPHGFTLPATIQSI